MSTLYIDRKHARLDLLGQAVEIRTHDGVPERVPLQNIERIVIRGNAVLTSGLLAQCWERRVSVIVLSGRRSAPTARLYGHIHRDAGIRLTQALMHADEEIRQQVAFHIVRAKITAQRRALATLAQGRPGGRSLSLAALDGLANASAKLSRDRTLPLAALRGLEGAAAAAYFRAFCRFFPPSLGFESRRRRPPPDPVNAALSLGYTLATFEAGREATIAGLDPAIGFLHDLAHAREALALDLVEPVRPQIDLMVHALFRDRVLTQRHFTWQADGAVLLGKAGRTHFYASWEVHAPAIRKRLRALARTGVRALRDRMVLPADISHQREGLA